MDQEERKSYPGLAVILSMIFNGLGQLYNGQIAKGIFIILLSSFGLFFVILGAIFIALWLLNRPILANQLSVGLFMFVASLIFTAVIGIYSIYDAHKTARNREKRDVL